MKTPVIVAVCIMMVSVVSCTFLIEDPVSWNKSDRTDSDTVKPPQKPVGRDVKTSMFFPFDNNTNWWMYSELGSTNALQIKVTDTISDDNVLYYRVAFQEHRVDTTDDWFKRVSGNIYFGTSLTGSYELFIPATLKSSGGTIGSGCSGTKYSFHDSVVIAGTKFYDVLVLYYQIPAIHGFEEIWLSDKIGIIQLKDNDGRWPVTYVVDSCSVGEKVYRF